MFEDQTSLSLEDLTSLSSISSSDSTSIHFSDHSTVSSCHVFAGNKSLPKTNYDLETISSSPSSSPPSLSSSSSSTSSLSSLINQRLRQKMKMLNIHPDNLKRSYKKVTFNCEHIDGRTVNLVKEISEKQSISRKSPIHQMETNGVNQIADNQVDKSELQSKKSTNPTESFPIDPSDISSVSRNEVSQSTIKQFKSMVENQKGYLDCLQKELDRLQKMETVLSQLHNELQKRVIDDLSTSDCKGNCACQSINNQESPVTLTQINNLKPTEPESDHSIDQSTDVPINQTSHLSFPLDSSASIVRLNTSKGAMESIHSRIDQMINKLHEETEKHSIGVQTSNSLVEPKKISQPPSLVIRKSANTNRPTSKSAAKGKQTKSVAWSIIIPERNLSKRPVKSANRSQTCGLNSDESDLSLQQAFRSKCGLFLARSQSRVRQINVASEMRRATAERRLERQLEEFILRNQLNRRYYDFLPDYQTIRVKIIEPKKIYTEKEMRQQTERLYSYLPEVRKLREEKRKEENIKTHRLMAKNFSHKLKSKAIEGKITFPLTQRLTN